MNLIQKVITTLKNKEAEIFLNDVFKETDGEQNFEGVQFFIGEVSMTLWNDGTVAFHDLSTSENMEDWLFEMVGEVKETDYY
jgi:hypothetical protein